MMDWRRLLIYNRFDGCKFNPEDIQEEESRTPFQRDADRISFSSYFRRLGRKTQVHPLNDNDHIHTRLSHSLEVASVGRSLGQLIGTELIKRREDYNFPEKFWKYIETDGGRKLHETEVIIEPRHIGEILYAACLAHDIGNPPFGHAGEKVIGKWFQDNSDELLNELIDPQYKNDYFNFDGNAMSYRIVTVLEHHNFSGGMKLSLPTLGTMLKYPWTTKYFASVPCQKIKFSAFMNESASLIKLAELMGLERLGDEVFSRHPLAYIAEAADDLCYKLIDIEDAVELKILPKDYLQNNFKGLLEKNGKDIKEKYGIVFDIDAPHRKVNAVMRALLIGLALPELKDAFIANYEQIINGSLMPFGQGGGEMRLRSLIDLTPEGSICQAIAKENNKAIQKIYPSRTKLMLELGSNSILTNVLRCFIQAIIDVKKHKKTFLAERILSLCQDHFDENKLNVVSHHKAFLHALDYIAGMSDHYATAVNAMLQGSGRAW